LPNEAESVASGAVQDVIEPGCPRYDRLVINNNPAIAFAQASASSGDEPRRMTKRLAQKLNKLAELLADKPDVYGAGAVLHVTDAYKAPVYGADPTLHNEKCFVQC